MAVSGMDKTRVRSFTTSPANLRAMIAAQNFIMDQLETSYTTAANIERLLLQEFNATVLSNVFGTESAATIGKNVMRIRQENATVRSNFAFPSRPGKKALQDIVDTATGYKATSVSVTAKYNRVYESAQNATVLTMIYDADATSMTLPGGQVITQ